MTDQFKHWLSTLTEDELEAFMESPHAAQAERLVKSIKRAEQLLAKSAPMQKVDEIVPNRERSAMLPTELGYDDKPYEKMTTYRVGDLWHHVGEQRPEYQYDPANPAKTVHHVLSTSEHPLDAKAVLASIRGTSDKYGFTVDSSAVAPNKRRKGFGSALYGAAARHHGSIESDESISRAADHLYHSFARNPDFDVTISDVGSEDRHKLKYLGRRPAPHRVVGGDELKKGLKLAPPPALKPAAPTKRRGKQWTVLVRGESVYHPMVDMVDLGPGKGNHYVLADGRQIHQDHVADLRTGGESLDKSFAAGYQLSAGATGVGALRKTAGTRFLAVKPGLHRVRQLRDLIEEKGGELPKRDIEKMGFNLKALGVDALVTPQGKLSSHALRHHIDQQPATTFERGETEYGEIEDVSDDWDDYPDRARDKAHEEAHEKAYESAQEDFDWRDHYGGYGRDGDQNLYEALDSTDLKGFREWVKREHGYDPDEMDEPPYNLVSDWLESGEDAADGAVNGLQDRAWESHSQDLDYEVGNPSDYDHTREHGVPARTSAEYNHAVGEQRHSVDLSQVFQLNLADHHMDALKQQGLLPAFQQLYKMSHQSGHPVGKNGIGWVRYTEDDDGVHVDEIQSDLGQGMKGAVQQVKRKVESDPSFAEKELTPGSGWKVGDFLKQVSPEVVDNITKTIFGHQHPSDLLMDGFMEHMRERGKHDTPVHIWSQNPKGELSGQDVPAEHEGYKRKFFHELTPENQQRIADTMKQKHLEMLTHNKAHHGLTDEERKLLNRNRDALYNDRMKTSPHEWERAKVAPDAPSMTQDQYDEWHRNWQPESHRKAMAGMDALYAPANFKQWIGQHKDGAGYYHEPHIKFYEHKDAKPGINNPSGVMGITETATNPVTSVDLPVHMQHTYGKMPKQMGFKPAKYGELKTQHNPELKNEPTFADKIRKIRRQPRQPLEKGAAGDWQKEGYKLHHEVDRDGNHEIQAHAPDGSVAGRYVIMKWNGGGRPYLSSIYTSTEVPHQRKGLATAAYQLAEQKSGLKMKPSDIQTDEGAALWAQKKPIRPFGKSMADKIRTYRSKQLEKTQPTPKDIASNLFPINPDLMRDQHLDNIETFRLPSGLYHHVLTKRHPAGQYTPGATSHIHMISRSESPWDRPLGTLSGGQHHGKPWKVGESAVSVPGKGFGHQLYTAAGAYHIHMMSDDTTSSAADNVWAKLGNTPGFSVKLSAPNTFDVHEAKFSGQRAQPIKTWGPGTLAQHRLKAGKVA